MRVSAKADYAVRAAAELAAAGDGPVKGEKLAEAQDIPLQFLEHILLELKHHGIVRARRGAKGGYWLARPADGGTVAAVGRAGGGAAPLREGGRAPPATLRSVLEQVTLADLVSGNLPPVVEELTSQPDA